MKINSVVVLEDGRLASGGGDTTIRLWGTDDHQILSLDAACCLPDLDDDGGDGVRTRSKTREIANRTQKNPIKDCEICLQPLIKKRFKLPRCGHIFHHDCLRAWLRICVNQDCPICRQPAYNPIQ